MPVSTYHYLRDCLKHLRQIKSKKVVLIALCEHRDREDKLNAATAKVCFAQSVPAESRRVTLSIAFAPRSGVDYHQHFLAMERERRLTIISKGEVVGSGSFGTVRVSSFRTSYSLPHEANSYATVLVEALCQRDVHWDEEACGREDEKRG